MTQHASAPIAPISRRAVAYLIDAFIATGLSIVVFGIVLVAAVLAGPDGVGATLLVGAPIAGLVVLAWFVVYTLMQAGAGSIGMRAQGVRLVMAGDGRRIGFWRALLRNIVFSLACAFVVGYFTPLFDGSGRFQGWHDLAVGSLMLDARRAAGGTGAGVAAPVAVTTSAATTSAVRPPASASAPAFPAPAAPSASAAPAPSATAAPAPAPAPFAAPTSAAAPAPAAVPAPARDDGGLIAFVPGISPPPSASAVSSPAVPSPATPSPAAPSADEEAGLDATVQGHRGAHAPQPPTSSTSSPRPTPDDNEDTRISIPGHRLVFTWDDGTRVQVSGRTLFGRNPAPEDGATIVSVRDETLSLSKTHFEAAGEPSGGWVMDRHSTNGVTLIREGRRIACPAGQRVPVRLGDALEIGDRLVTIGGYA